MLVLTAFQIIKTSLNVTIRDEAGNTVSGASIKLYKTEEDYNTEKNVVAEGVTDEKGFFRFKELEALSYFVQVMKDDKDNSGGGERINKLESKKLNKVTIIIQ